MDKDTKDHLHRQLIRLGDMMGDGLHHEPNGKLISKEYKKVLKALGILPKQKRRNNTSKINEAMDKALKRLHCPECQGKFKQTRSGSMRGICINCGRKYSLLKRQKRRNK